MLEFNLDSLMFPKARISYWLGAKNSEAIQGNPTIIGHIQYPLAETFKKIDYNVGAMFGWNSFRRLRRSFTRRLSMPIHQIGNRKMVEPLPFTHTRKEWRVVHLLTLLDFEVRWMGLLFATWLLHVIEGYGTATDFKRTPENYKVSLFWLLFFRNGHVEPPQMRPPCSTPMK